MKDTQDRFVRLRNMAENLRPGHTNADFLTALLDANEGNGSRNAQRNQELHSVSANDQREEKAIDCQGRPCEDAPSCRLLLSPADVNESFFVCGQDSLVVLLQETARGCPCGSSFFFDGDNSVKKWMVMSYVWNFLQERPQNKVGKFVYSWQQVHCKLQVRDFYILPQIAEIHGRHI